MHVTTYDYLDVVFRGTNTWVDGIYKCIIRLFNFIFSENDSSVKIESSVYL